MFQVSVCVRGARGDDDDDNDEENKRSPLLAHFFLTHYLLHTHYPLLLRVSPRPPRSNTFEAFSAAATVRAATRLVSRLGFRQSSSSSRQ